MKSYFYLLLLVLLSCQTQKAKSTLTGNCFSFDQRQCQADDFASLIKANTQQDLFAGMTTYLTNNGILVQHIRIDMEYHEVVCDACEICPEHHRFFVSINPEDIAELQNLNLFHLESISCADYFE